VAQVPRDVFGQSRRTVVAPNPVLLQRLHHDPIEIAGQDHSLAIGLDGTVAGGGVALCLWQC
jgi:hypothetical protein